jgi:hypothetical protein
VATAGRSVRLVALAGTLDVVAVVVFVAIGRASHDHGETATGLVATAWPFLAGLGVGWVVMRCWREPLELVPTGVGVWLACVAVGMVLRVLAGQGTAVAFVAVALGFLGLELLGWRALARIGAGPRPVMGLIGTPDAELERFLRILLNAGSWASDRPPKWSGPSVGGMVVKASGGRLWIRRGRTDQRKAMADGAGDSTRSGLKHACSRTVAGEDREGHRAGGR